MTVYVTDANIFIDLLYSGLLGALSRLGLPIVTTQLVLEELDADQQLELQIYVASDAIEIRDISMEEINKIQTPRGLSVPDRSVICLAVQENGVLLSEDGLVRRTATIIGLEVRGLLWLFDEFISRGILSPREAADKLEYLVFEKGSRQPQVEFEDRLKKWRHS